MRIVFCKSKWEMWDDPLAAFLQRVRADGFEATEIFLKSVQETPDDIMRLHEEHGLGLVAQILTDGATPEEHVQSLERQFEVALRCKPLLVNTHAGRDIFSFEENCRVFERIIAMSRESGLPILVETHRGRPTYSAVETRRYLEALPALQLTADFSHWMVVHESSLEDQEENVALAIARSCHIHARVGHEEGPQVNDPRAPEWKGHVDRHVELWHRIVEARRAEGASMVTITPEFGPPGYMPTLPFTAQPVSDVWESNVYIRNLLRTVLASSTDGDEA